MSEILVIAPEDRLRSALERRLSAEGMNPVCAGTGTEALSLLNAPRFDAILLHWQLPDMDGMAVLHELRTRTLDTPVMLLSSRTSVAECVQALDGGADDYLLLPFHMDECMARVRRLVRVYSRPAAKELNGILCIADLTVDTAHHVVTRGGRRLALSAKECAIMEYMACNPGVTLTRQQIEEHLSPEDISGSATLIPVYIHYLRRKVDDGFSVKLLHTVRNTGYVLRAGVSARA
ncbi:MAG: response regulator transcription factor [Oscillospiraceae bacterium]|nr:response regulator transcription factor [Oscillospiraceae bacterium]